MLRVYGMSVSGNCHKVRMALEALERPYAWTEIDTRDGSTRKPEFLRLNPNGHIPVLQDGDFVLWESMAINLYLARKYDKGLWPKTVEGEGRAYQWSLWAMTELAWRWAIDDCRSSIFRRDSSRYGTRIAASS